MKTGIVQLNQIVINMMESSTGIHVGALRSPSPPPQGSPNAPVRASGFQGEFLLALLGVIRVLFQALVHRADPAGRAVVGRAAPSGGAQAGIQELLWKPRADKDGKLVVVVPAKLTGSIASVRLLSPDGARELGRGRYSGLGNGHREHFRFSAAGNTFPHGVVLEINLKGGGARRVTVSNPGRRTELAETSVP